MPEKWTKSMPACLVISANRNGLDSCGMLGLAGMEATLARRSPSIAGLAAPCGRAATSAFTSGVATARDASVDATPLDEVPQPGTTSASHAIANIVAPGRRLRIG